MKYSIFLLIIVLISCDKKIEQISNAPNIESTQLEYSDCLKDLNHHIANFVYSSSMQYDFPENEKATDSIKLQKFKYGVEIYAYTEMVDSMHKLIPKLVMPCSDSRQSDTAIYRSYKAFVDTNKLESLKKSKELISILNELSDIHAKAEKIRVDIEHKRTGEKDEKIICQLCSRKIDVSNIHNIKTFPELFVYIEKQFNITFRELHCSCFAISLLDTRKVAYRYKVRI
jgi:hypothetical protein